MTAPAPGAEDLHAPGFADVLAARGRIRTYLDPTPLRAHPGLADLVGTDIWVKHENLLPTGAFKVRGGVNLVAALSPDERSRGILAASTGNHGQSLAFACRLFGCQATIYVPAQANRVKVASIEAMGARVVRHGADYDEARERCEEDARRQGRYVHSGNEPLLIAGVGTYTLEMLEAQPDLDVILVPIGGGSGAAGACIVARTVNPHLQVIGVQSEQAPGAHRSWQARRLTTADNTTFAEGLSTRTAFELPQRIMRELLSDFILVPDAEIRRAVRLMIEHTRTLVEPAGAAALAGALRLGERLQGRRTALVCTGANITPEQLREVLAE